MKKLISNLQDKIPSHFTNTLINVYSSEDLNNSLFSCSNLNEIPTEFLAAGFLVQVDHFENDEAIDWIEFDLNDYVKAAPKKKTKKQLARIAQKERTKSVNGRGCKIEYKVFDYDSSTRKEGDLIKVYFSYAEIPNQYWTADYMILHDYYGKLNDEYHDSFFFIIADHI